MAFNLLFITSNRLGDAVLSTAVLNHLLEQHPDAEVTIACGPLPAPLFATVPGLRALIPMPKRAYGGHWLRLWREVVKEPWDLVVDLRDSLVSRVIASKSRLVFRALPDSLGKHKVEQFAEKLKLPSPLNARLWFSDAQLEAATAHMQPELGPILSIGPAANWAGKEWPMDRFQALIARLTAADGVLANARVAVSAAPNERERAISAWDGVPDDRRIDLMRNTDPAFAAACLASSSLYVGNDSGLMHIAAAVGVPTLGLFGPSDDRIYAPYGIMTDWVRSPVSKADLIRAVDGGERPLESLMDELDFDVVASKAEALVKRAEGEKQAGAAVAEQTA
ncbi:MAG: glycosyltransferase family 9 protein [Pseudomonadota bacterium]